MNPLLFGPILDIIKQVLGGLGLDPEAKARAQAQALEVLTNGSFDQKAEQALALAQINVNNTEAQSESLFKSGWRPFTGWSAAIGVTVATVWAPLGAWAWMATTGHPLPPLPVLDSGTLFTLLGALLGIGTLRTVDKVKGAA
jgi:hypothetical protein